MDGDPGIEGNARDIAAGMRERLDQLLLNGIGAQRHDRYRAGNLVEQPAVSDDKDDIGHAVNNLHDDLFPSGSGALLLSIALDDEVLALDMPETAQFGEKRANVAVRAVLIHIGFRFQSAEDDKPRACRVRLCACRTNQADGCRGCRPRDDLPPPHVSSLRTAHLGLLPYHFAVGFVSGKGYCPSRHGADKRTSTRKVRVRIIPSISARAPRVRYGRHSGSAGPPSSCHRTRPHRDIQGIRSTDLVMANDVAAYSHVGVVLRMIRKSRQSLGALILTPAGPNRARGIGGQPS